jgi:methylenetetrahydrofolate dehydrogenase (NADP+)/methenyltetrahydrofolate cyclohydrolase
MVYMDWSGLQRSGQGEITEDPLMLMDGKALAQEIRKTLREEISRIITHRPCLAAVLVGDNAASHLYVRNKIRACEEIGMLSRPCFLPATTTPPELTALIQSLNRDSTVHGILVQLPLPPAINPLTIASLIDPMKDVDAVNPINLGKLLLGDPSGFVPCTPLGVQRLLMRYNVPLKGKHVVIAGRSNIVGKPLAALLMQKADGANATITLVHSQSDELAKLTSQADVLIAAIGSPHFFKADMVKSGAVVVDVGQNQVVDSGGQARLVGDVDFVNVQPKAALITPVPGGVGPMTISMLLSNTLRAVVLRRNAL